MLTDRIAAAKKIDEFLKLVLRESGLRLKYRIRVVPETATKEDEPVIFVDLAGPDSTLVLERNGELLRGLEHLAVKVLRLEYEEQEKVSFDCMNYKANRLEELRIAASVAAERVRETKMPYEFAPMNSKERRTVHLALRDNEDLRTESAGEGPTRHVVLYPKDYKGPAPKPLPAMRRRR